MASNKLKGLTIEIGGDTSGLVDALADVNKKSRDLSSELGQINKLLKLDPGNTELLAQKQKVLADAISNTEKKLSTLKEAERQVQEQFERGEVSEEQVRALQREIIETERKLGSYRQAAEETAEAMKDVGDTSDRAADDLEDVASGADKAADGLDDAADKAEEADEALGDMLDSAADAAKTGLGALAAAAGAAIGAVAGLAEETREYRVALGKLNVAFEDNGHSAEVAYETYAELQGILGETDQAAEAATLLSGMCKTEEELAEWTDILTGVYGKFGASLPIEGLAEAANETVRTGQVTGSLADALNWASEEGETFGLQLKKQIKFTELSAKELDKLSKAERESYEAQKKKYDSIEEWNAAVEEAATAEDKFNLALSECTDEQERQQLITKYLTKTYKKASDQYKETNKEVIRANKATEEWNATLADIGGEMEPVLTDIKELGVVLLKEARDPLRAVANFVRDTFLPGLVKMGRWFQDNLPAITAGVAGAAATFVVYKASVLATELASKGLTIATLAQAAAQKALNLAMAAGPWGLAATAVVGVTAALVALSLATKDAWAPTETLTEAEQELIAAADEAARAFRDQRAATDEALGDITAEMSHTQDLAAELQSLADASGRVKAADQERVNFILNELNEALGTEYQMVDGVILKYDELQGSIKEVIQAKLANSLVEAANADYIAAIQNEGQALESLTLKEKDYQTQLGISNDARDNAEQKWAEYNEAAALYGAEFARGQLASAITAQATADKEAELLAQKKTDYDQAALDYKTYFDTIANYEEAQTAVLNGNYDRAVDILARKGGSYGEYSDKVDTETKKVLDTLYKEAVDAGLEAQRTKDNFEKGVDGYTKEMVQEADLGYKDALRAFETAYADAEGVGEDLGDGLSGGMDNKRSTLFQKARGLVSGIISAMRKEADSNSPARKTIEFGEDVGEGAEIGIENKTEDVARAGARQAEALLDAYSSQEVSGQEALRGVAERQASRQVNSQLAAASVNGDMLARILAAIEDGKTILLDGDLLVGGTAGRMDNTLGQRRTLVELGAL